jgi:hypothetical protein
MAAAPGRTATDFIVIAGCDDDTELPAGLAPEGRAVTVQEGNYEKLIKARISCFAVAYWPVYKRECPVSAGETQVLEAAAAARVGRFLRNNHDACVSCPVSSQQLAAHHAPGSRIQ